MNGTSGLFQLGYARVGEGEELDAARCWERFLIFEEVLIEFHAAECRRCVLFVYL